MSVALRRALEMVESDSALCARLSRDPKGTVLYVLPQRLAPSGVNLTADDELAIVALAELFPDADGLRMAVGYELSEMRDLRTE